MPRNTTLALFLALPLTLAACATPQERCISRNTSEYRTVNSLLAEVEGNLARGYAWDERQVTRQRLTQCQTVTHDREGRPVVTNYSCWRDFTETERFRVAIDPVAEARKRDGLVTRRNALAASAERAISACREAFPDES